MFKATEVSKVQVDRNGRSSVSMHKETNAQVCPNFFYFELKISFELFRWNSFKLIALPITS
jgi:hypothetical protein